ncbi:MAG: exodeoxyribonuclease VII large subunit [Lachnospiraceae bacterium]|nr:exodeoxyribonuclease VII large subunit [Lachnospiraceae bacterium]
MQNIYSVAQINSYIKNMFAQDFMLKSVLVRGEVSNVKYHSSGHIYFTLKDASGAMACVMFSGYRTGLSFHMESGHRVIVQGSVEVYERDGKYQLYAKAIQKDGIGDLHEKYEQLKKDLYERGMFDEMYKQPIPKYIRTLGVVTASTGAALQDIINITTRRNPYVQIILCPAQVQGDGAAQSIVKAIETLEKIGVDVMIVGRGGGSIEDLWAFNEECVAQAVFDCSVPIISAVGHETDTTIIDFVSDLRAPTPSAAAELAVYSYLELQEKFHVYKSTLAHQMERKVDRYQQRVDYYEKALQHLSPETKLRENRHHTVMLEERLHLAMERKYDRRQHAFYMYVERMRGLSPLDKISGGFGYVSKDGTAVKSAEQLSKGDAFTLYLSDGKVDAQVTGKEEMTYGQKG